jgi:hypothetical protein
MNTHRVVRLCAVIFLVVSAASCRSCAPTGPPPEVRRFDASPIHVCNCQPSCPVDLRWATIGETATLSSDNPVLDARGATDALGTVPNSGARTVGVRSTTRLTIEARSEGMTPARQDRSIEVFDLNPPMTRARPLGNDGRPQCQVIGENIYWTLILTEGTVTAMGEELDWDHRIQVRGVRHNAPNDRPIRVRHFGVDVTVPPGIAAPLTMFPPGIAYGGSWILATPLAPGENCGGLGVVEQGRPASTPPALQILVELTCGS